jgi:hypothetical protein
MPWEGNEDKESADEGCDWEFSMHGSVKLGCERKGENRIGKEEGILLNGKFVL